MTEIMFNPPGCGTIDGDEFEFLELKNTGTNDAQTHRPEVHDGITFTFPNGTMLAPGQFFVLARNAAAVRLQISRRGRQRRLHRQARQRR